MRIGPNHTGPGPWGAGSLVVLLVALALAGCVQDPTPNHSPPTLIEAHQVASKAAKAEDTSAMLAGFMANDGLREVPAPQWLLDTAGEPPEAGGFLADGRSASWVFLYATSDGRVLRALVGERLDVDLRWVIHDPDPVAQMLWGMNLGGRLLTDSDEAVAAARSGDPEFDGHARAHRDEGVAIVSSIASTGGSQKDMVYAVYWGPETGQMPFSRYAYVHHFTGDVVRSGDSSSYREDKRVVLVDESFTLGPVPREVREAQTLGFKVDDALLSLTTSGVGEYTVRLLHENLSEVARVEGVALVQQEHQEVELGTLDPGEWVLHVEVTGRVEFDLKIEGVVPVNPVDA